MKLRSFMFLTLAFIAISCGKDPVTTPAPQVASEPPGNVAHAEMVLLNQSDAPHFMDIYLPETTGETPPQPVLFYIHGGSWYMNSRAELTVAQMKALSGGKYVVVTTDYTLAKYGVPNLVVPQVLTDLAVNIKWLRDHASEYDMDGKRIIIMGHSSGSHMAALCALDRSHFTEVGANFDAIKGAICLDGGPYLNDVDKLLNGYPWSAGIRTAWTSVAGNDTRVWPQYIPAKIIDTSVTPPHFCWCIRASITTAMSRTRRLKKHSQTQASPLNATL